MPTMLCTGEVWNYAEVRECGDETTGTRNAPVRVNIAAG